MKNIKTSECNFKFTYDAGHDIDCYNDGKRVIVPFQFSPEELEELINNEGKFFYSVHCPDGKVFFPMNICVYSPFVVLNSKDALLCICYIDVLNPENQIWVWNTVDRDAPEQFATATKLYVRSKVQKPYQLPMTHKQGKGEFAFALCDEGYQQMFRTMGFPDEDISDLVLIEQQGAGAKSVGYIKPAKQD